MDKATVLNISNYMIGVQTIFGYAFVGDQDRTLGVLSLDFQSPLSLDPNDPEGNPVFPSPDNNHDVVLDRGRLRLLLSTIQSVLESFVQAERRH